MVHLTDVGTEAGTGSRGGAGARTSPQQLQKRQSLARGKLPPCCPDAHLLAWESNPVPQTQVSQCPGPGGSWEAELHLTPVSAAREGAWTVSSGLGPWDPTTTQGFTP